MSSFQITFYLKNEISDYNTEISAGQIKKWNSFKNNLLEGIEYYKYLFSTIDFFKKDSVKIQKQLKDYQLELSDIEIPSLILA